MKSASVDIVDYIIRTEKIRKSNKLVLRHYKHESVTTQTLGGYEKITLKAAGSNTILLMHIP